MARYKSYADMVKAAKLIAKNKDEKNKLKKLEADAKRDAQYKGKVPTGISDSKKVIKDKVTVVKSNSTNKRLQNSKNEKVKDNFMQKIALKIKNDNENKNIKKAGELEKNKQKTDKKKITSEPKWKQYSSISAAKKAGSLYYSKGGKKFAAVFAEDLKGVKGSSPSAKLRAYLNDKEKKRK